VDVHDVRVLDRPDEVAYVGDVGPKPEPAREVEAGHAIETSATRSRDDLLLGAGPTTERHHVAAPLELTADARGPVRVGRPAAARYELQDLHATTRYAASATATARSALN